MSKGKMKIAKGARVVIIMQFADHLALGKSLKQIRALLMQSSCLTQKGKARYKTDKALAYLEKLRSTLDDIVFQEHPEKCTHELVRVYYGHETEE